MSEVRATRIDSIAAHRDEPIAGAFDYVPDAENPKGMRFICPCGCGNESFLPIAGSGSPGPQWDWNGNLDKPTMRPSVFNTGMPCRWHGWLTAGVWRSC